MAKIQPLPLLPAAASSSPSSTFSYCGDRQSLQKQQVSYTVWMKSLVFNGNGCTVYGPDGSVAFRVDNYGSRGGREVFFMDRAGNTLIRIRRKGFGMFRRWEACRCHDDGGEGFGEETTPWFRVRRAAAEKGARGATVTLHGGSGSTYRVGGCASRKSDYRVSSGGEDGAVVAEVARKQTAAGIVLGEDVMSLTVGSEVDHLLVLGVVVVCALMNRAM